MARKKKDLPMPDVDFTKVGRKWKKAFAELTSDAERDARVYHSLQPEGSSQEAIEAFNELYEEYRDKLKALGAEQFQMVSDILLSVPQECLTSDAPDTAEINWMDGESFDWFREDVLSQFLLDLQTGELAKKYAKN